MSAAAPRAGAALTAATEAGRDGLPVLVPYVTAGFPHREATVDVLLALERAGCAAAEVGLPFSDPLADGPTIQRSSQQALRAGMSVDRALDQVASARARGLRLPLAAMTYINPVLSYGVERFCAAAAGAGLQGLILPDLPLGEGDAVRTAAAANGLAVIPLVAPTTTDARLHAACDAASGFVYCVSTTGTTGARAQIGDEAYALLDRVGLATELPRALGFGLSRHEHLLALRGRAEAAVVGAALIEAIGAGAADPAGAAERFCRGMLGEDA